MEYTVDKELGSQICDVLIVKGVETPFTQTKINESKISTHFTHIMKCLGLNLQDDSLAETPARVAKMFARELFYGLNYDNFPKCTTVQNKMQYDEMLTVKKINVSSVCEHHFVTIDGKCKIAYIPKERVLGLSKFARVVDFFARRPQIQERLTEQIFYALAYILETNDIAIQINAVHFCMKSRGIKDQNSHTITTKLGGVFKDTEVRNEFLSN